MQAGFINVNSLRAHIDQIRQFLNDNPSYDLFGIAETWLDSTVSDDVIRIPGFKVIRQDRNVNGGGVALLVKEHLRCEILTTSNTERKGKPRRPEFIFCSITDNKNPPVLVAVIYRPPKIAFLKNVDLINSLRTLSGNYSHKIVMGDLNADLLRDGHDARLVRNLAAELSLQLVQHGPTHFKPTSRTWIDIIFVDDNDTIINDRNIPANFHSKHNIIDVTIKISQTVTKSSAFTYRDYKKIVPEELAAQLSCCDWTPFEVEVIDTEQALDCLCVNLTATIDSLAPVKTFIPKKGRLPWIDAELAQLLRKRDTIYRRYKRTGRPDLFQQFITLRKDLDERIDLAKTSYLQARLSDALSDGNVWKELRGLGLLPKHTEDLNGFTPDELNDHFAGVSISPQDDSEIRQRIISNSSPGGFAFKPIDINDVILAVSHFSSQACGEDGISQSVIVNTLPVIGTFLVKLFNSSLTSNVFPSLWKRANIIPLKKSKAPSSPSEFRPIALLCFLSKVLEKIAHAQLTEYLETNRILDPHQTGFRRFNSTQTALLKLTDDIRSGMDKKLVTFLLLFDFSKAFDKILPSRLLERLRVMGLSRAALSWIDSYFHGRIQRVSTNYSGESAWLSTNLGVPQGSVLGPLFFCLYINDLQGFLGPLGVQHLLYADDLQIYCQFPRDKLDEGLALIQRAARTVSEWATGASLKLNAGKTKAIVFGNNRYVNNVMSNSSLRIDLGDGIKISLSDSVESLGVILDARLTWKNHVDKVAKKFNSVLYHLRFFRKYTTETLRKRLVEALLFPHLDYC